MGIMHKEYMNETDSILCGERITKKALSNDCMYTADNRSIKLEIKVFLSSSTE